MKKNLFFAAFAVVAMASCSKNEAVDPVAATQNQAIGFETFIDRTTKGSVTDIDALEDKGFSVIGYNTNTSGANFQNVSVKYNGSAWTYDDIEYWADGDNIDFYAYGPNDSKSVTAPTYNADYGTEGQVATASFTVTTPEDITGQDDVVVATSLDNAYVTADEAVPTINLDFQHILSKIAFTAQAGVDASGNAQAILLKSIKVTVAEPAAGSVNGVVSEATYNMISGEWEYTTTADNTYLSVTETNVTEDTIDSTTGLTLPSDKGAEVTDNDKYLMIIPQTVGAGAITVKATYTVDAGAETSNDVEIPDFTFEQGKQYTFNLILADKSIRFATVTVSDFDNGNGSTMNL